MSEETCSAPDAARLVDSIWGLRLFDASSDFQTFDVASSPDLPDAMNH
jgi:hypothetical protein